jgi:hypothetical protein
MAMWAHHGRGEEPASEGGRYKGKSRRAPQTCLRQAGCALRFGFCDTAEVGVDAENERSRDSDRSKTLFAFANLLLCGSGLRSWGEDAA